MNMIDKIFKAYINEAYSNFKLTNQKVNGDEFAHDDDDEDIVEHAKEYKMKRNNEKYLDYLNEEYMNIFYIDEDGYLSSRSHVDFSKHLPNDIILAGEFIVLFGTVASFNCSNCGLTSLKGCPFYSKQGIKCSYNLLTDLLFCPICELDNYESTSFNIECQHNPNLTSLDGCRMKTVGTFNCSHTSIKNLYDAPNIVKSLNCSNTKITSLEGDVKECSQYCDCGMNPELESILGIDKIGSLTAPKCPNLKLDPDNLPNITGMMSINQKVYKNIEDLKNKITL